MAIPGGQPVYGGEYPGRFRFWLMPRDQGMPRRIEGTATIVADEWNILMDAIVGDQGEPGEPAEIIRRDFSLTDAGDLPDEDTLDESDYGRGWYIAGQWHIFDHGQWYVVSGALEGPPGVTPDISMTAETIEAEDPVTYGPIEVEESGPSTSKNFHFKIPGVPGPEGPAASIGSASDFNDDDPAVGKTVGVTSISPTRYGLIEPQKFVPRKFTIPHTQFVAHTGSETRFLIASQDIPAFDFDWYPDVLGHVNISRSNFLSSVQAEVEVRIGDTGVGTGESADLCGLGPYDPSFALLDSANVVHIMPHFSDSLFPSRAISPDSDTGRVLAGATKTIYVYIHKIGGSGSYVFTQDKAQVRINIDPAADD